MNNQEAVQPGPVPNSVASDQSVWSRISNVFFSPSKAFEGLQVNKGVIITLVVLTMVLAAAMSVPIAKYQAQDQVRMMETSTTLPPQVIDQMRQNAQSPGYIGSAIGAPIAVVVMGLIGALLAWVFGGFILGGQRTGYAKVWTVELLSGLIPLVGGLLKVPLIIAKESTRVSFGPAAFLGNMEPTAIFYWLMSYLDIFAIWGMIVTGFGLAAVFGFSKGKGITISVIVWIIFMFIIIGAQMFGLSMAGVKTTFF